jgi:hypothetical protein
LAEQDAQDREGNPGVFHQCSQDGMVMGWAGDLIEGNN